MNRAAATGPKVRLPYKLFSRLLASHILLVTLPLLATGWFLIRTAKSTTETTILKRNREIAIRSARQIELQLNSIFEKLRLTANNPTILDAKPLNQQFILQSLVNEFPVYKEIALFKTDGTAINSTSFSGTGAVSGLHRLDTEAITKLRSGLSHNTEVFLSDEQLPVMEAYEPIKDAFDDIIAFLGAEVDLREMWVLVDSCKIGGSLAEAFVFRSNGQYIAHTERRQVIEGKYFLEESVLNNVAASLPVGEIYVNNLGVDMAAACAPIGATGWGMVIQEPAGEAFAVVGEMQFQIQMLLWASVAVAAMIAFFYSRAILRPVGKLVQGTERIASGDLYHRIEPLGRDEVSQLAEHFNNMSAKLRNIQNKLKRTERLETLGKLSSVLSHEIRNPLNSMVINMQILSREFRKNPVDVKKLDHYHRVIVSEIKRVDELVSNFLMIAKPPKLELTRQRITTVVDEVISTQQSLALARGIRIERQYDGEAYDARIDINRMKQVFLNIVINAIQAMPGGGKLIISIDPVQEPDPHLAGEMLRISFADRGKGIKKEHLENIFDFYYSTKPKGTGLGLSVAQQIVEEHGGDIRIESEYGKGTEVVLLLPREKEESNGGKK